VTPSRRAGMIGPSGPDDCVADELIIYADPTYGSLELKA
jgi:hypothetical protein